MKLLIKQRVFSWSDTYDVYDEHRNAKYYVRGEIFSWGHKIHVYEKASGREVGAVYEKILSFMPTFEIEVNKQKAGTIQKRFTLFSNNYDVHYMGWQVQGNFIGWDYQVVGADQVIMHITKEPFNWGDTYVVDYRNSEDELHGLLLVIAIDAANCSKN